MKINDQNLHGLGGAGGAGGVAPQTGGVHRSGAVQNPYANATGRSESTPDGDRVQLSNLSQGLRVEIEDTPERLERVAQLRDQVRTGAYQPDAADVSRKLIDEALGTEGIG